MRVYKKRTNRESVSEEVMKAAICLVLKNRDRKGFSIRSVARMHKINYATLSRYIKKCKRSSDGGDEEMDGTSESGDELSLEWKKIPGQVFSRDHEVALVDYINLCSRVNSALRPKHARSLAYQYARKFDLNHPTSWDKNKKAGEDWLTSFLRRNESLLPFSSQAMRSRAASFNEADAKKFYDRLKELYDRHDFKSSNIYNMSVSSVTTIVATGKIVRRSDDSVESAEKSVEKSGETVTLVIAASAIGKSVPPMLIFPRKKYHHRFVENGPADCVGIGNATGSMTDEALVGFVKHLLKYARPSDPSPVLLIMDNSCAAHLSVPLLDFCKSEAVSLLSLPPHCTQKLQPLDHPIAKSFSDCCRISMDEWLKRCPGKKMTVHDLPAIIKEPLLAAMTSSSVIAGFARTGVYPFVAQKFDSELVVEPHFLTSADFEQPTTAINSLPMEYPDFGHLMKNEDLI